jgi:hypothetical protein
MWTVSGAPGGGEKTFHSQHDSLNRTRTSGGVVPVQSLVLMSDDTTSVILLMTLFEVCVPEDHVFSVQEMGSMENEMSVLEILW